MKQNTFELGRVWLWLQSRKCPAKPAELCDMPLQFWVLTWGPEGWKKALQWGSCFTGLKKRDDCGKWRERKYKMMRDAKIYDMMRRDGLRLKGPDETRPDETWWDTMKHVET
jgi:hypothetical protein